MGATLFQFGLMEQTTPFLGNRITENNGIGIVLNTGSGHVVTNNYIADNALWGIDFERAKATLRNKPIKQQLRRIVFL